MGIQIHGHRGGADKKYPDNTLNAIQYGLQQQVDAIEVDVLMTRDQEIVLHHDEKIKHTEHAIHDLTLTQIRGYDKNIATLQQWITLMKQTQNEHVILNVEMKCYLDQPQPYLKKYLAVLVCEIEKNQLPVGRIFLQSFNARLMSCAKSMRPQWKIGVITSAKHISPQTIKQHGVDVWSCDYKVINKHLIDDAHKLGLEVYVWTVNKKSDIKSMLDHGVDAIITNAPKRCRDLLY